MSQEEARSALQALLAPSKVSAAGGEGAKNGVEERAPEGFRAIFRAELQEVLKPPPSAAKLAAELEEQVKQLLTRNIPPAAPAEIPSQVQPELIHLSDEEDEDAASVEESGPAKPRRKLVIEEEDAANLRREVAAARKRLSEFDQEVTKLTRQLRQTRQKSWNLQQQHSAAEARISKLISERAVELEADAVDTGKKLEQEESRLRQVLADWRSKASRFYSDAKHQESLLQQERDAAKGGDVHRILATHPAGEVFLFTTHSDNESDDAGGYGQGKLDYFSDDEDDHIRRTVASAGQPCAAVGLAGAGGVPKPRSEDSDKYDSDDSSEMPSPSGRSGSGSLSRSANAPRENVSADGIVGMSANSASSSRTSGLEGATGRLAVVPARPSLLQGDSDTDSDKEIVPPVTAPVRKPGVPKVDDFSDSDSGDKAMPNLPSAPKGPLPAPVRPVPIGQRNTLGAQESADEVSSEDGIDEVLESSSRSL